jgi:hypothetical protein
MRHCEEILFLTHNSQLRIWASLRAAALHMWLSGAGSFDLKAPREDLPSSSERNIEKCTQLLDTSAGR